MSLGCQSRSDTCQSLVVNIGNNMEHASIIGVRPTHTIRSRSNHACLLPKNVHAYWIASCSILAGNNDSVHNSVRDILHIIHFEPHHELKPNYNGDIVWPHEDTVSILSITAILVCF